MNNRASGNACDITAKGRSGGHLSLCHDLYTFVEGYFTKTHIHTGENRCEKICEKLSKNKLVDWVVDKEGWFVFLKLPVWESERFTSTLRGVFNV